MPDAAELEAIARAAVMAGSAELRDRYRDGTAEGDYSATDVKAAADEAAERQMLPVVRQAFPDHEVFAEEAGRFSGSAPYRWIIDPLDGTNNFTAGLPTFTSSIAVLREDTPVLAVVQQPATGETYVARRDGGVSYEGEPVTADSDLAVSASTVVSIVGREVPHDQKLSKQADAIQTALDSQVKRVLESWAPTIHSGLLARGRIQGLVQFHPDEEEQAVTELLTTESNAAVRRDGPLYVAASDQETLSVLWETVNETQ